MLLEEGGGCGDFCRFVAPGGVGLPGFGCCWLGLLAGIVCWLGDWVYWGTAVPGGFVAGGTEVLALVDVPWPGFEADVWLTADCNGGATFGILA